MGPLRSGRDPYLLPSPPASPAARRACRPLFLLRFCEMPAFPLVITPHRPQGSSHSASLTTLPAGGAVPSVPEGTLGGRCCSPVHGTGEKTSPHALGKCHSLSFGETSCGIQGCAFGNAGLGSFLMLTGVVQDKDEWKEGETRRWRAEKANLGAGRCGGQRVGLPEDFVTRGEHFKPRSFLTLRVGGGWGGRR